MTHLPKGLLTVAITALIAGCASTSFISTWKAPEAGVIDPSGRRVAAAYISTDESSRRVAEDVLVQELNERGAQGVAAYSLIPSDELRDLDQVKKRLAEANVDGVVIMRVVDERERTRVRYTGYPYFAPYYWRFTGYWGYGWGAPYAPTEVSTDTILRIETLVYSLKRDKLLWAGTSRTVNPSGVSKLVREVANQAAKEMKREGLLAADLKSPRHTERLALAMH